MNAASDWKISGIYFEACNCDSVCPCYSAKPPTHGYCEGNCAWSIQRGHHGALSLDGLSVILALRCDGFMRQTDWQCWFYIDDRADAEQFEALRKIFTLSDGGHLAKTFGKLWQVRSVERAPIEMNLNGWQHRASILGKLGLAIGPLKPEAGPTLCRVPNVPGVAATAEEDWCEGGPLNFNYRGQSALSTTFAYQSDT